MNISKEKFLFELKSKKYKRSLEKVKPIFESVQSEIRYFKNNHLKWISECNHVYYIDLNERYLIFGNGNVAFLSKEALNEESLWDWVKSAGSMMADLGSLLVGAGAHAATLVYDAFGELGKIFKGEFSSIDWSKFALGMGGMFEILALISSFIPAVNVISPAFGIIGAGGLLIGGILELSTETLEIPINESRLNESEIPDSAFARSADGVVHTIMGIVTFIVSPLHIFGGHGVSAIKTGITSLFSKQVGPVLKNLLRSALKKQAIIKFSKHNTKHFAQHYLAATIAYLTGKGGKYGYKKINENAEPQNSSIFAGGFKNLISNALGSFVKGVDDILNSVAEMFSFSEDMKKWVQDFFGKIKGVISKIISFINSVISKVVNFFTETLTLKNIYVDIMDEEKVQYQNGDILVSLGKKSIDQEKLKKVSVLKDQSSKIKEKIGKNDQGENIQYVGNVKFDSNKIQKKTDSSGNEYLVVTALDTGKKYGVVRKEDGSYEFKKTNENNMNNRYYNFKDWEMNEDKKINESILSSIINIPSNVMMVLRTTKNNILKWAASKTKWSKQDMKDIIKDIVKEIKPHLDSRTIDALQEVETRIIKEIDNGKYKHGGEVFDAWEIAIGGIKK